MFRLNRLTMFGLSALVAAGARHPSAGLALQAQMQRRPPTVTARARQLVAVTTPDWNTPTGTLRRFTRASSNGRWHVASAPIPVVVGRTGLAWGLGFDHDAVRARTDPHKHEGDGRSPAGAFPLDTAFGFAPPGEM